MIGLKQKQARIKRMRELFQDGVETPAIATRLGTSITRVCAAVKDIPRCKACVHCRIEYYLNGNKKRNFCILRKYIVGLDDCNCGPDFIQKED